MGSADSADACPYKAQFASYLVHQKIKALTAATQGKIHQKVANPKLEKADIRKLKVCIIGAGCAGLYTAELLSFLGIDFEIWEASERAGGRVRTHYFTDKRPSHLYYDIGAMRFPKTPIMDRTFDLFERTGVRHKLMEYFMEGRNQPTRFNDITAVLPLSTDPPKPGDPDPFMVSQANDGPVPDEAVKDPAVILARAYDRFRNEIKNPRLGKHQTTGAKDQTNEEKSRMLETARTSAWKYLLKHDKWSLRGYLSFVEGEDSETIDWLETQNSATGWFDQAFTENVLESLAFDYYDFATKIEPPYKKGDPPRDGEWYCIEGGTEELIASLAEKHHKQISYETRVKKMVLHRQSTDGHAKVAVYAQGSKEDSFDAVINTSTLGALQKMDTTQMEFSYSLKAAIRSLHYDTSTKVGMQFKYPWWMTHKQIRKGGLGKTDMPLRICVYPSYNTDDGDKNKSVLLCSYTWGQDSERVAAYINEEAPEKQIELRDLMFYNLARLHSDTEKGFEEMYKIISEAYETHYVCLKQSFDS